MRETDTELQDKWNEILEITSKNIGDGEQLDVDAILFLIGVQELGQLRKKFSKDQKLDLMHIAICTLLEPYGYYKLQGRDDEGWPHFELVKELPALKDGEQARFIKEAIIRYFEEHGWFEG